MVDWDIDIKVADSLDKMSTGEFAALDITSGTNVSDQQLGSSSFSSQVQREQEPALMELLSKGSPLYDSLARAVKLTGDERLLIGDQELQQDLAEHPDATVVVFRRKEHGEVAYKGVALSREDYIQDATFGSRSSFLDEGSAQFKFDVAAGYQFVPVADIA